MSSPWKDPRSGIYYIRRAVPSDLKDHLGQFYKRSLQTRDPDEAKSRYAVELAKCERLFQQARDRVSQTYVTEMSREEAERIADDWLAMVLEEDEGYRKEGLNAKEFAKYQDAIDIVESGGKNSFARGDISIIEVELDDFLDIHGVSVPKNSQAYVELGYAFLKASVRVNELIRKRQQGEIVETPLRAPLDPQEIATAQAGTDTLSRIYDLWKAERKPEGKLATEWDTVFRRFQELHGDLLFTEITRRHIAAFKDAILQFPIRQPNAVRELTLPEILKRFDGDQKIARISPSTVKKYIGAIHSVFEWAVDNGYRDDNPASRIKIREARNNNDRRLPYDRGDLKLIFSSPVYSQQLRPKAAAGEAAYWIPLIGLYTGARLEEIGQLRKSDVRCEDGIWFIDINTLDEGKRVKTQSSKRKVPLHSDLLKAGFLQYRDTRAGSSKQDLLFPLLKQDSKGKLTGNWSKWWGRYARETVGITDPRKVFHSFRHTFKDACRAVGIGEETHDALTGHSGGGVGRQYGHGIPVKQLQKAIEQLQYPEEVTEYLGKWGDNKADKSAT